MQYLGVGNGEDGLPPSSLDTNNGNAFGSVTGTAGAKVLSVTDRYEVWRIAPGDLILIYQTQGVNAGQYEVNVATETFGTGSKGVLLPLANTYTSTAQVIRIPRYKGGIMSSTLSPIYAWNGVSGGIAVMAFNAPTTISGIITASGYGFRGGASTSNSNVIGDSGEGTVGPSVSQSRAANGNGGGGNNDANGAGAGGGNANAGANAGSAVGGIAAGLADLSTAVFGGGGGGFSKDGGRNRTGGNGGGLILIFHKGLTITGAITNAGLSGYTGDETGMGGGAAGSTKLVGNNIVLGTNLVTALAETNVTADGSDGRIRVEACSLTGTTNPSASQQIGGHTFCGSSVQII